MWRLRALIAVATGVGAHLYGLDPGWCAIAGAATLVVPAFAAGLLRGARTPGAREHSKTLAMTGVEFEDHVARIARTTGLPVITTPATGDFGVDLVVGRRPNRLAIQCKRQSRPVGAGAIQEVVSGAPMHDCAHTMVVTNHDFTSAARRLADRHGCVLVAGADASRLGTMILRAVAPVG